MNLIYTVKNLIYVQALNFLVLRLCCVFCHESSCYHDSVSMSSVPTSFVNYVQRGKRDIESNYEPLKIHIHFNNASFKNKVEKISKLILLKAVEDLSKIFRVNRVNEDSLLLKRNPCVSKWTIGKYKGRCARWKANVAYEFCENKIDKFQIPPEFLEELFVYDFRDKTTNLTIKAGPGAKNSNYILFVTSVATSACFKDNIEAYGSYCKLDQLNRPIAGIINFCPQYFTEAHFEANNFLKVVLHELFHVLGFSKNLFLKFNSCSLDSGNCELRKNAVLTDTSAIPRFVLPNVVKQMQLHFNCSDPDFGGPLEKDMNGDYQSHWDPLLMYGSIMMPKLLHAKYMFIDPITLAYFADTGWYKVNFTYSQNYIWGKGEGCTFGSNETCEQSSQLCLPRDYDAAAAATTGCDFLQSSKSKCEHVAPYHRCGVFPPDSLNQCDESQISDAIRNGWAAIEGIGCFMTKGVSNVTTPQCMPYKCSQVGPNFTVKVNSSVVTCPENKMDQETPSLLLCPKQTMLCSKMNSSYLQQEMVRAMVLFGNRDADKCNINADNLVIDLSMRVTHPSWESLINRTNLSLLKADILKALAQKMGVEIKYMLNATMSLFQLVQLEVKICVPQSNDSDQTTHRVVGSVFAFTTQGTFTFIVDHGSPFAVIVSDVQNNPKEILRRFDTEGYKILVIVPVILLVFLFGSGCAQIARIIRMRRHRSKRKETEGVFRGRSFRESVARMSMVFKNT